MAIEQEHQTIEDKEYVLIKFSNGALRQLRDLKEVFGLKDETEVVEMGISVLQKFKEDKEREGKAAEEATPESASDKPDTGDPNAKEQ